jgi:hypothetical protein
VLQIRLDPFAEFETHELGRNVEQDNDESRKKLAFIQRPHLAIHPANPFS